MGIIILGTALAGLAVYVLTRRTADPGTVYISQVNVTPETIELKKLSFVESAVWYVGYSTHYDNGVLTIKIYERGPIRFPGDQYDGFTLSIPNTYGNIHEIHLSGGGNFSDKVIWKSP